MKRDVRFGVLMMLLGGISVLARPWVDPAGSATNAVRDAAVAVAVTPEPPSEPPPAVEPTAEPEPAPVPQPKLEPLSAAPGLPALTDVFPDDYDKSQPGGLPETPAEPKPSPAEPSIEKPASEGPVVTEFAPYSEEAAPKAGLSLPPLTPMVSVSANEEPEEDELIPPQAEKPERERLVPVPEKPEEDAAESFFAIPELAPRKASQGKAFFDLPPPPTVRPGEAAGQSDAGSQRESDEEAAALPDFDLTLPPLSQSAPPPAEPRPAGEGRSLGALPVSHARSAPMAPAKEASGNSRVTAAKPAPIHPFYQRYLERKRYFVQPGDTLEEISARLYGTPERAPELRRLNADRLGGMEGDRLEAGVVLELP